MDYLVFMLIMLYGSQVEASRFRCDYTYFPSVGWIKLHRTLTNQEYAQKICAFEGAELVSPTTKWVKAAIQSLIQNVGTISSVRVNSTVAGQSTLMKKDGTYENQAGTSMHPFVCHSNGIVASSERTCDMFDDGYNLDNRTGHCYKFYTTGKGWYDARDACASEGSHLMVINSDTEASIVKELFQAHPVKSITASYKNEAFIGFTYLGTIYGETLAGSGYDKWAPGQPDNAAGNEFCGSVNRNSLFVDDPCLHRDKPYICERHDDFWQVCEQWQRQYSDEK